MKCKPLLLWPIVLAMACTPMKQLQTVERKVPCLGAIGKANHRLFSKAFTKVGQPIMATPISVGLQALPFTKPTFSAYKKHKQHNGETPALVFHDSLETAPKFFQLRITDLVTLQQNLNDEANTGLRSYLASDAQLQMLSSVSFLADPRQEQLLQNAEHLYLILKDHRLTLAMEGALGRNYIQMQTLDVFDFETAGFCWRENQWNRPAIATISPEGQSCPRGTEKKAAKVDLTRDYLKL